MSCSERRENALAWKSVVFDDPLSYPDMPPDIRVGYG